MNSLLWPLRKEDLVFYVGLLYFFNDLTIGLPALLPSLNSERSEVPTRGGIENTWLREYRGTTIDNIVLPHYYIIYGTTKMSLLTTTVQGGRRRGAIAPHL